jgi:hypothetical protein
MEPHGILTAMRTRALAAAVAALALVASLAACSPTVALDPAANAASVACAAETVSLPDTVAGLTARETNAQGTGAWGSPADVVLACGVAVPPPTATQVCVTVSGVDWLRDATNPNLYVFTTYGRDPATAVSIDPVNVPAEQALDDLATAVAVTPKNGHQCTSLEDTTIPTATPTP